MIVYLIENKLNGKGYVGQTTRALHIRIADHRNDAMSARYNSAIHKAIRKYGWSEFEVSVLEECQDIVSLNLAEISWIERLGCLAPNGYNLTSGGKNGGKVSDESRARMSAAQTGRVVSPETLQRMSAANIGKKASLETREKISAANIGKKASLETREKISASLVGRTRPAELCERWSLSRSGENAINVKLTWEKVREIRLHASSGPYDTAALATQYGVTVCTINSVIGNRTWVEYPTC